MTAAAAGAVTTLDTHLGDHPDHGPVRWLLSVARPGAVWLAGSVVARTIGLVLGAALLALPAWAVGQLVEGSWPVGAPALVVLTVGLVVLMAVSKAALRYAEQWLGHVAAFRLMGELRVWMLAKLTPQSPALTEGSGAARVLSIAHRDIDRVEVFFAHTIAPAVTALIVPPAAVVVAWTLAGPVPALALAVVLAFGLVVPLLWARTGDREARELAALRADQAQRLADAVRCHDELLAFDAVDRSLANLREQDARLAHLLRSSGRRLGVRAALGTGRLWLGTLAVLAAELATGGTANLPGFLVVATLVAGTAPALDSVERLARSLPAGLVAAGRLQELAARPPLVRDSAVSPASDEAAHQVPRAVGGALDAAGFTYPLRAGGGIAEVTLEVAPGQVLGLCGATGSGKSTVMRLLQRRVDADEGRVSIGGLDVRELPLTAVHRDVVVVDQQPFLLQATLRENLRLGAEHASDAELVAALRAVCAEELLDGAGLDEVLGARGGTLSGGERQRLALARGVLRAGQDALLVLDEATSHQDAPRQSRILAHLRGRRGGTVLIAHRLDVLRDADEIAVVAGGRIVERGTWASLTAVDGAFSRLLEANGD